jgi:hypothetical protein
MVKILPVCNRPNQALLKPFWTYTKKGRSSGQIALWPIAQLAFYKVLPSPVANLSINTSRLEIEDLCILQEVRGY